MQKPRWIIGGTLGVLTFSGVLLVRAAPDDKLPVEHPDCSFFGPQRDRFVPNALQRKGQGTSRSVITEQVTHLRPAVIPGGSNTNTYNQQHAAGSIDSYIWADFAANNITPAPMTTDWEFIRRVTLDLTGRIPDPNAVLQFVNTPGGGDRASLIDSLLASPQWVDKWTMFYGDLFQNTQVKNSTGLNRFPQGRNAFYQYIYNSLANDKPYNQIASDLISMADSNSYNTGPVNYLLGGWVGNGPIQDSFDQMTANTFDVFLGMAHVNCLLCHNGRGHLDSLSLWASNTTRYQAWQLSSFMSHTSMTRTAVDPSNTNVYYWSVLDNQKGYTTDYALNTTTGNRPARVAPAGCKSGQPCYYVPPQYIFNGDTPAAGGVYRVALAKEITNDFQFARAAVNYLWAYFFGMGLVDPPDTFDPARLDPDNPPPAPWTLQPTNARLLNALAQQFIASGYDVKAMMRQIVNSQTYQLSSRYNGTWNEAWEPYFARKFVRRLWGEEVHDAVVQSSGTLPSYSMTGFTDQGYAKYSYAMQEPDVVNAPSDGNISPMLDSFLRGNRDDQPRHEDGSILQALNLMNNTFFVQRSHITGTNASVMANKYLSLSNTDLVNTLYLNILSRYPTSAELQTALAYIPNGGSQRLTALPDFIWSLYNKVDFVFNY